MEFHIVFAIFPEKTRLRTAFRSPLENPYASPPHPLSGNGLILISDYFLDSPDIRIQKQAKICKKLKKQLEKLDIANYSMIHSSVQPIKRGTK